MEPLDGAQVVVATNHLVVGDLVAQAVSWLVRINVYIGQLVGLSPRSFSGLFSTSPFDNLFISMNFSFRRLFRLLGLVTAIGFLGGGFFLLHSLNVFIFPRPLGPLFPFVFLCPDRRRLRHSLLLLSPAKVQVQTVMLQLPRLVLDDVRENLHNVNLVIANVLRGDERHLHLGQYPLLRDRVLRLLLVLRDQAVQLLQQLLVLAQVHLSQPAEVTL